MDISRDIIIYYIIIVDILYNSIYYIIISRYIYYIYCIAVILASAGGVDNY